MNKLSHPKAQTLVEYIVLLTVVLGVFIAMQVYVKRSLQGRMKSFVDDLGEQYDPRVAGTDINHTISSITSTQVDAHEDGRGGILTTRTDRTNSNETVEGYTTIEGYGQ